MELTGDVRPPAPAGDAERWLSVIGGGALAIYGASRGSRSGLLLALMGSGLAYGGMTGRARLGSGFAVRRPLDEALDPADAQGRDRLITLERTVTVRRGVPELYRLWRSLERLPRLIEDIESVLPIGGNRYHWRVRTPFGGTVEWEAGIVEDVRDERIAWRSLAPDADASRGELQFQPTPNGQGTMLHVTLAYRPPAGAMGAAVARLVERVPRSNHDVGGTESIAAHAGGHAPGRGGRR